jgi:Flp pilus assembly protein TadB
MATVYHTYLLVDLSCYNKDMALFVNQDDTRTKLQKRISEDLAAKAKKKALESDKERPDGVDDSAYLKNTKQTTSLAWVWALIAIAIAVLLIWVVVAYR